MKGVSGQLWRRLLQPFSFVVFGVGGMVLGMAVYPVIWILPLSRAAKTALVQKGIHYSFRVFLWFLEALGGMEFRFEGTDLLPAAGPGLVIANHPTLLDVVVLIAQMPQADCIVKKGLWSNIFLWAIVKSAGYIPNDDGPELLDAAIERIRQGRIVIIFPEGTRSFPGSLLPFNKGFAHITVRSGCPLWPVVMTCDPPALNKGRSVFSVPEKRARLTARVGHPLNPADYYDLADSASVAVRKVASAVEHYFEEKVEYGQRQKS